MIDVVYLVIYKKIALTECILRKLIIIFSLVAMVTKGSVQYFYYGITVPFLPEYKIMMQAHLGLMLQRFYTKIMLDNCFFQRKFEHA